MKHFQTLFTAAAFLFLAAFAQAAILSPEQRAEEVKQAQAMLGVTVKRADDRLLAEIGNPFSQDRSQEKSVILAPITIEMTDEQILAELSKLIKPTGVFAIGGRYTAFIHESRVQAGSKLKVKYLNKEYEVNFINVTSNFFRISYGEAELVMKLN